MDAILWNLEHLSWNFALHSETTQGMCMRSMIGISVLLRMLDPVQGLEHTFLTQRQWGRQWWWLQMYPKRISPTLHVKVMVYSLVSILPQSHPTVHLTPSSWGLSTPVPSQLPGEHSSLATFTCSWLIILTYICAISSQRTIPTYTPGRKMAIKIFFLYLSILPRNANSGSARIWTSTL